MNIWVDADACPSEIKDIIIKAALKRCIQTVFVSNKIISIPQSPFISTVKVSQGPDVADEYIAENANNADLVITQDIPLAAMLVPKGIVVISVHGVLFTHANIGERLSVRNFMSELRDTGIQTSGPRPFSTKDKQKFANTFDQQLVKRLKYK
ncbi:MAG: YaiI/YqxD family protein [bacterium]